VAVMFSRNTMDAVYLALLDRMWEEEEEDTSSSYSPDADLALLRKVASPRALTTTTTTLSPLEETAASIKTSRYWCTMPVVPEFHLFLAAIPIPTSKPMPATIDTPHGVRYTCPQPGCNKTYRYKADVKWHAKQKHGPAVAALVSRSRSTREGKPHQCPHTWCPSGFASTKDLRVHLRVKHNVPNRLRYEHLPAWTTLDFGQ